MSDTREIRAADQELLLPFGLSPHDLDELKKEARVLRFVPGEPKRREDSRLGGLPYWRVGATWPTCKRCGEPLVFLIQWHAHDIPDLPGNHALLWFYCDHCKPWHDTRQDAFRILLLPFENEMERISLDETPLFRKESLPEPCSVQIRQETDYPDTEEAVLRLKTPVHRLAYARAHEPIQQAKVGGYPFWHYRPDVPRCEACGQPMAFFAQLASDDETNLHLRDEGHALLFHCRTEACRFKQWALVTQG